MRAAASLALLLIVPLVAPATADVSASGSFAASAPCFVGGQRFAGAGAALPGCTVSHAGTIEFVGCDGLACTFEVAVTSSVAGAPPGEHAITSTADDKAGAGLRGVVCAMEETSLGDAYACAAVRDVTIDITSDCRFFSVQTRGVADVAAAGATILNEFRICLVAGGATFEAI
jgi:hypothetical protein